MNLTILLRLASDFCDNNSLNVGRRELMTKSEFATQVCILHPIPHSMLCNH